jgi:hypothetical protein
VVIFYIFRSKLKTISDDLLDWIVAIGGTFSPLFFRPALEGFFSLANNMIIVEGIFSDIDHHFPWP